MKKLKTLFLASFISILIFWAVQMFLYIGTTVLMYAWEGVEFPDNMLYELIILSIITFGYLGWFNVLFLLFLYFTKVNRIWINNYRICFIESLLYWIIFYIIRLVMDILPDNLKFYYTQPKVEKGIIISNTAYVISPYFSDDAQLLYVYIILFFIILLYKLYIKRRTNSIS